MISTSSSGFKQVAIVGLVVLGLVAGCRWAQGQEQKPEDIYVCGPELAVIDRLVAAGHKRLLAYRDETIVKEFWGNRETGQWVLMGWQGGRMCTLRVGEGWLLQKSDEGVDK